MGPCIQGWRYFINCTFLGVIFVLLEVLTPSFSDALDERYNTNPGLAGESSLKTNHSMSLQCKDLRLGQYYCADPVIDHETQQPEKCSKDLQRVQVRCYPAPGIFCNGMEHDGTSFGFQKDVPCKYTNGKKFSVALILSVFLGMFGVDRFYLGYPAIGLLKLCTFGFMLLGQLVDVILIGLQVVGPADGSHYIIDYYGPGLINIAGNNDTYLKPQYDYEYDHNVEL